MKKSLVGITGGIGAGKSALARVFTEAGYPVLSADELAREVVAPGSEALGEIVAVFGPAALAADGSLNRSWVRSAIAGDPSLRARLETITHPRIQALSLARASDLFEQGQELVFYEAPLLFEAGSDRNLSAVICVHAADSVRVDRVMKRDGRPRAEVEKLLHSQMPQEEKMRRSSFLVRNEGSEAELRARGMEVLAELRAR
jgi:dephospho-CoA kinase